MATNTISNGIMATLDPLMNNLLFMPVSELKISLIARKTIKETTAIILYVITSAVVTVVVVVVTVDIMIYSLNLTIYKTFHLTPKTPKTPKK